MFESDRKMVREEHCESLRRRFTVERMREWWRERLRKTLRDGVS